LITIPEQEELGKGRLRFTYRRRWCDELSLAEGEAELAELRDLANALRDGAFRVVDGGFHLMPFNASMSARS